MFLRSLGILELEGGNCRSKPLLLLTYLVLEGPVVRRRLAELFYGDTKDPRDSLSSALRHLRAEVGEHIHIEHDRVSTTVACDAAQLLNAFDKFQLADVESLYQGAFLVGLDLPLGEEIEEWVFSTRESLARGVRSMHLQEVGVALARGHAEEAARWAERSLEVAGAPELEPGEAAQLLPLLGRLKEPAASALRQQADEYGLTLDKAELRTPSWTSANPFMQSTSFIGRQHEIDEVSQRLLQNNRLVTICGMGGLGKTRLALRVAEHFTQQNDTRFQDGVYFIRLENVTSPENVVPAVGETLGLRAGIHSLDGLQSALALWQALLVFDNFEQLLEGAPQLSQLLQGCPQLRLLVTSRSRLSLSEESVFYLSGLPTKPEYDGSSDAAQLFFERAARLGSYTLTTTDRTIEVNQLCRALDGHPLGIELAASLTRLLPIEDVLTEVQSTIDVLSDGPRDAPPRHRSLRAAFEPSWLHLSEEERSTLACLSIFRNGFRRDAAAYVARANLTTLSRLVDTAMLQTHAGSTGRFGFHPLLRVFIKEKADANELASASQRYLEFYDQLLEDCATRIEQEPKEVLKRLEEELENIIKATYVALESGNSSCGARLLERLVVKCDYLDARGARAELLTLLEQAGEAAEASGDILTAHQLFTALGDGYRELNKDFVRAALMYDKALTLARAAQDRHREIILLSLLGIAKTDLQLAGVPLLEQAYALAVDSQDTLALCHVLQNRSYVALLNQAWQDMYDYALEAVNIARTFSQKTERQKYLFYGLLNWGEAAYRLNDFELAKKLRLDALQVAEKSGNEIWLGHAHLEAGDLSHQLANRHAALKHFQQALELYRRNHAKEHTASLVAFLQENNYSERDLQL